MGPAGEAGPLGDDAAADDEWPPRADRARACFWLGSSELENGSYWHASQSFLDAARKVDDPALEELARGLFHLAVAGFKGLAGDDAGKDRQLVHARRRLAPFLPRHEELELELVELLDAVGSDRRGPADTTTG